MVEVYEQAEKEVGEFVWFSSVPPFNVIFEDQRSFNWSIPKWGLYAGAEPCRSSEQNEEISDGEFSCLY